MNGRLLGLNTPSTLRSKFNAFLSPHSVRSRSTVFEVAVHSVRCRSVQSIDPGREANRCSCYEALPSALRPRAQALLRPVATQPRDPGHHSKAKVASGHCVPQSAPQHARPCSACPPNLHLMEAAWVRRRARRRAAWQRLGSGATEHARDGSMEGSRLPYPIAWLAQPVVSRKGAV